LRQQDNWHQHEQLRFAQSEREDDARKNIPAREHQAGTGHPDEQAEGAVLTRTQELKNRL